MKLTLMVRTIIIQALIIQINNIDGDDDDDDDDKNSNKMLSYYFKRLGYKNVIFIVE